MVDLSIPIIGAAMTTRLRRETIGAMTDRVLKGYSRKQTTPVRHTMHHPRIHPGIDNRDWHSTRCQRSQLEKMHWMVLRRPVELARVTGQVPPALARTRVKVFPAPRSAALARAAASRT